MGVLSNKIRRDKLKPGDHIYSWRCSYLYAHHGIYAGNGNVIHFTLGAGQEIGTGTIVNRFSFSSSSSCPRCGDSKKGAGVISSCLECFLSGGKLYKFQYGVSKLFFVAKVRGGTCTLANSDPAEDVLYRAEYLLQNGFGNYNLFKNNCEDFAIYCKTGLVINVRLIGNDGRSGQVASFKGAVVQLFPMAHDLGALGALGYIQAAGFAISPLLYMVPVLSAVGCLLYYCCWRIACDIGGRRDVTRIPVEKLVARSA